MSSGYPKKKKGQPQAPSHPQTQMEYLKIDPHEGAARRCTCCAVSNTCFRFFVGLLVLLALAAVIVILILAWNQTSATLAIERYCGTESGVPDDGSHLTYMITLNLNSRIAPVGWEFELTNTTDVILTAGIYGPITPPSATAPLFFALCGSPSSLVCTPSGSLAQTNPGGAGLNGYITQLRAFPIGYYLQVAMALGTTYTSPFTQSCGRAAG